MARRDPNVKPDQASKARLRAALVRRGVPPSLSRQLSREDDEQATAGDIESAVIAWAKALPKGRGD